MFRAAISDKSTIQQAIEKVQKEALVDVEVDYKQDDVTIENVLGVLTGRLADSRIGAVYPAHSEL